MNEERQDIIPQDAAAPRWVGIVVVALAVVSLVALGAGWTASTRSKALEQQFTTQTQQFKQNQDILNQRLAKAEETNAQVQGELSVVTNKMKLSESELKRARQQTKKIREEDAKQLAELQSNINGQLATKASAEDVTKLGADVTGVKTDLEATKGNLQMARDQFGNLIARNHDEIEELRRLGDHDFYEFTINKRGSRQKVGDIMVELRGTNPKRNLFSVVLFADDQRYEKKNRSVNEPIFLISQNSHGRLEFVVNKVSKDKIVGYLAVPKAGTAHTAQSSGN